MSGRKYEITKRRKMRKQHTASFENGCKEESEIHILNNLIHACPPEVEKTKIRTEQKVGGTIPTGDIYFQFEFSFPSHFAQLGEARTNEINHDIHPE